MKSFERVIVDQSTEDDEDEEKLRKEIVYKTTGALSNCTLRNSSLADEIESQTYTLIRLYT